MAKKPISLKMEDDLVEKLDKVAKSNHRKRGPEINVAVEFYLKYQGVDFDTLKQQDTIKNAENNSSKIIVEEDAKEETTELNMGNFGFKN